jgi:hypothetical protein
MSLLSWKGSFETRINALLWEVMKLIPSKQAVLLDSGESESTPLFKHIRVKTPPHGRVCGPLYSDTSACPQAAQNLSPVLAGVPQFVQ